MQKSNDVLSRRTPLSAWALAAVTLSILGFAVFNVMSASAATVSGPITGVAGKCLDAAYGRTVSGSPAEINDCNGSAKQSWNLDDNGTINSGGYCLDIQNATYKVRANVLITTCNDTPSQKWNLRGDGTIQSRHLGVCLAPKYKATANGTDLWTWPCDTVEWQNWTLPAGAPMQTTTGDVTPTSLTDTTSAPVSNPQAATAMSPMWAAPDSKPAQQASTWKRSNPEGSALMSRFAKFPVAEWYGNWTTGVKSAVSSKVTTANRNGTAPILVAYNIPGRDCGSYSAGGAGSDAAYKTWIREFAAGIGKNAPAIVVVEPDAIPGMDDCLNAEQQAARMALLADAVNVLREQTDASIYLDAGNPGWRPAELMASRLAQSNVAKATGFSVNVSNFWDNTVSLNFAETISAQVNGKHFVIDSSRNGKGHNGEWCNPDGRAFGTAPTLSTGLDRLDGFLYIKKAGESDGTCGPMQGGTSAPAAGQWWPEYAVMLAKNAGW